MVDSGKLSTGSAAGALAAPPQRVAAVRRFSRVYTSVIGLLREGLLDTPYSLTEARVIFEVAQKDPIDLSELRSRLNIDAGYLSRVLNRLETAGVIARARSADDARRQVVNLTESGRAAFEMLDRRSADQVASLLNRLTEDAQARLVAAMRAIETILTEPSPPAIELRPPAAGDLGWVVERHGALYQAEYGWDETFEALVARVVADYVEQHDPRRTAAWIAEVNGERVGSIFCMRKSDDVAQLRLLLVEPSARGMGIGGRLVDTCLGFARRAGYSQMMLWTNDVLHEARRIYERAGFRLEEEESYHGFGHDLVSQTWWLTL